MNDISNLRDTIVPKSDQLNAEQLLSAPITILVTDIKRGSGVDQPVIVSYLNDEGRPYKPCKTCRKILIFAWGDDGSEWIGKRMTLYCDPDIKFGGVKVGGIRISHLSNIERDMAVSLNVTKGKKGEFIIKKLADIRSISEMKALLSEAAKGGVRDLQAMWKKLNADERGCFGDACPDEFKKVAKDFDDAVPTNLQPTE
mgnify:FL=1